MNGIFSSRSLQCPGWSSRTSLKPCAGRSFPSSAPHWTSRASRYAWPYIHPRHFNLSSSSSLVPHYVMQEDRRMHSSSGERALSCLSMRAHCLSLISCRSWSNRPRCCTSDSPRCSRCPSQTSSACCSSRRSMASGTKVCTRCYPEPHPLPNHAHALRRIGSHCSSHSTRRYPEPRPCPSCPCLRQG